MIKKLLLLAIILIPYFLIFALLDHFTNHYDFILNTYEFSMKNSYFAGCSQRKLDCRLAAKDFFTIKME